MLLSVAFRQGKQGRNNESGHTDSAGIGEGGRKHVALYCTPEGGEYKEILFEAKALM